MQSQFDALSKTVLLLGFVGIVAAISAAHLNPATGYELSIYRGTPVTFWAGTSFALLVSILVVFSSAHRHARTVGAFLGGLAMTTIVSLPIVRGYHFVGESDSLSHLGTAKDMHAGVVALTESRYPVVHPLGSVLHDATGLAIRHALLILVVAFVVCFFVFVPLVVRELTDSGWTTYVGLFSGLLLLPINHLSPSLYVHPTSQAIMYAPAFLFVFFVLYRRRILRHSAMFLPLASMFVLLHPQQAASFVLFFGVIAALQIGYDLVQGRRLGGWREWVIPEVAFYATVFWLWASNLPAFWRNFERVYMIPFVDTEVASSTASRTVSLAQVGGSLPEVFLKLFLVPLVYVVLTGLLVAVVLRRFEARIVHSAHETIASDGGDEQMLPVYIVAGLFAVTMIFLVYLGGGISDQYFRHLGMLMVFGTVLGTVMIGRAMRFLGRRWSNPGARRSIALVLVLCTVLSLPVVFISPYVYFSSEQVTEAQMSGYATTFEFREGSIGFADVRSKTHRYGHAILGTELRREAYYEGRSGDIPDHFVGQSLRWYYANPVYVPVTAADRIRDPVLWNGFRFDHEDFAYLDAEPGINRVQTNGGYDLYLVEPRTDRSNDPLSNGT